MVERKSLLKNLRGAADKAAGAAKVAASKASVVAKDAADVAKDAADKAAVMAKDTADKAAATAHDVASHVSLPEVKLPDIELPDIKLPKAKSSDAAPHEELKSEADSEEPPAAAADKNDGSGEVPQSVKKPDAVPVEVAMRLMYLMMAADGEVLPDEEMKFEEICGALDEDFEAHRDEIVSECVALVEDLPTDDGRRQALTGVADAVLASAVGETSAQIPVRLLVWDLIVVAHSDSEFGEDERELVDYVAHMLGLDEGVYAELLSSYMTLEDLDREAEWAKGTDRQYRKVEAIVDEVSDRRDAVIEGVMALVTL